MKPQSMLNPKLKGLYPHQPNPYLKTWRVYDSEEEYYFLRPKPKGALPLAPKLRVSLKLKVSLKQSRSKTESKSETESKLRTESISKDNTKDIIKTKPITNLKLKLKIVSTAELSMNVINVMQNLKIK